MRRIDPPLCVALDAPDLEGSRAVVDALRGVVPVFKVGLELFCAAGRPAVDLVLATGAEVFLDLKVNDIPNQAAGAVKAAAKAGVDYLTVHTNAGRATLRAATGARIGGKPRILAVTVLTSLDDAQLAEVGVSRSVPDQVAHVARIAAEEGADGLVLAASELASVRSAYPDLLLVTPGIRPAGSDVGDQRRVATPAAAVAAGADLLVVGRPITAAPDPVDAARRVLDEMAQGARAG
jgi:orotidine-5'-phosphate decarboxylase